MCGATVTGGCGWASWNVLNTSYCTATGELGISWIKSCVSGIVVTDIWYHVQWQTSIFHIMILTKFLLLSLQIVGKILLHTFSISTHRCRFEINREVLVHFTVL